ncbi:L-dopachrome tautomerase-related protein [Maribacter sp. 1_MG-2023]|uniref:L-dopachrome tautomerase-related protein n=1 Tax=Maribacter sp. 1_MG-2023 TaxID=3062677 RepID=UPI0026E3532E|nr:L-dopachrome tautomerase-related protein [Maribacter sp. 1_MG-2023]MDO6472773.1 L-dopachrome tautomerase-related protein [Maribacter sp. 1_MG-2023]
MKKLVLITALSSLVLVMCKSPNEKKNVQSEGTTTQIEKVTHEIKTAETVFSSQDIRPGNLAVTSNGRLFVTMNPLVAPTTKVFELNKDGKNVSYPNDEYATGVNSILKAVIGIRADSKDNLWLLDMGAKQFVVWDTKNEKLVKTIAIPEAVIKPASFLQDFIIDEKHNRVIIADMTQGDLKSAPEPAFIVINTENGEAKRMAQNHPSMMPEMEGGFALNPIAIDPKFNWVYFGALHGETMYRVPASSFNSDEELVNTIERFGVKSFSDGMAVDKNGNVYVTNVVDGEIGLSTKEAYTTLAKIPEGQSWPDGLYVANDGFIYGTVDQLNRTAALNNGEDVSTGPYLVVKTKLLK